MSLTTSNLKHFKSYVFRFHKPNLRYLIIYVSTTTTKRPKKYMQQIIHMLLLISRSKTQGKWIHSMKQRGEGDNNAD